MVGPAWVGRLIPNTAIAARILGTLDRLHERPNAFDATGTAATMTRHVSCTRRRARWLQRSLCIETLEPRLALSSQNALDAGAAATGAVLAFPDGLNHADPMVRAVISSVTTSAPVDEFFHLVDPYPVGAEQDDAPTASLIEAGALVGLNDFREDLRFAGVDGSGYSIVIIDSGIDLDHPFFGPDANGDGVADRIVYRADFVEPGGSGDDLYGHGTHVSSIAASQDETYAGVAPGVNIINLRALNAFGSGSAAALEEALQWVVANVSAYNIVSVNMSLSFGDNNAAPTTKPALGLSDEIAALAAQDVVVASASGNLFFGYQGVPGVAYPSADPNSLSIGAVWDSNAGGPFVWSGGGQDFTTDADRLVSFSQRHPTLTTVFAPGAAVAAAAMGGGVTTLGGTSMATPFVTGLVALAQQLSVQVSGERLSVAEFKQLIKQTGVPIFDGDDEDDNVPNTHEEYRRIDVLAMANAILSGGLSELTIPGGATLESSTASPGGQARIDFTLANQGASATGPFTTAIYLSADDVIDASDVLLGTVTDELAAGQAIARKNFTIPMPTDLAAGTYYFGLLVDDGNQVTEGNESNNVFAAPLEILAAAAEIYVTDVASGATVADGTGVLQFGEIEEGTGDVVRTLRLHNDGNTTLELGDIVLPTGFAAEGFPASLAPLSTADFTIRLEDGSDPGAYAGNASFASNDANESPFEISLSGAIIESDDHGNDAAHATAINVPGEVQGSIFPAGDVDWFRFSAAAGATYQFAVTVDTLGDSALTLINGNGTTILAVGQASSASGGSTIVWTAPVDGDYFLEVRGQGALQGSYQLALSAEDDHGNEASTATPTSDPSVNVGILETPGDADWFSFAALAGVQYRFEAASTAPTDVALMVVDVDGTTVLQGGGGDLALIDWTATADATYYVVVVGELPESIGGYALTILGKDDHGDNAPNATVVPLPATVSAAIEAPQDVDWYAFAAVQGAQYQFVAAPGTLSASRLQLYAQDGQTVLLEDDDGGTGLASSIDWTAPSSGIYFIAVSGFPLQTGTYDLSLDVTDDHGDAAAVATPTTDPSVSAGILELEDDADWFSFQAFAGVEYSFGMTLGALSSAVLRVVGQDGLTELAVAGGAPGASPVILWTAPADGLYYLEAATTAGSQLGDYQLVVTGDDDHGDNSLNATPLAIPSSTDGVIERSSDADWFAVESVPDVEYRVEVALGTLSGVRVRVVASDAVSEVAVGIGGGESVSVSWTATERGAYFIEVIGMAVEQAPASESVELPVVVEVEVPGSPTGSYQISIAATSAIPGDYNRDLIVDGADFLAWQRTLGTGGAATPSPLDSLGFEDYAPGPLHQQNGWVQLGPRRGTAVVQSSVVASGSQAVQVDRFRNVDNWWGVPLGEQSAFGPLVLVQWDMRVTATEAVDGAFGPFFGVQAYDGEGPIGLLGSLGVDATTLDVMYQQSGDGVLVETGVTASPDVWHSFALLLDFDSDQFTVFFEGQALGTSSFVDLGVAGVELDRLTDADIAALAAQLEEPSQRIAGTAYFDNFRILDAVSSSLYPADGNGDGVVDGLDLAVWKANYGVSYAPEASNSEGGAAASFVAHAPLSYALASANSSASVATRLNAAGNVPPSLTSLAPLAQRIANAAPASTDRLPETYRDRALLVLEHLPQRVSRLPEIQRVFGVDHSAGEDRASKDESEVSAELDAALGALFG